MRETHRDKIRRFGKFLACSGYPDCKFTKPYQIKTGAKCPECGGELVERLSKKKRTFYGCSKYPECKFATFNRPLPEPAHSAAGWLRSRAKAGENAPNAVIKESWRQKRSNKTPLFMKTGIRQKCIGQGYLL